LNSNGEKVVISRDQLLKMRLLIDSENNFATASGLASSSSGLSCLSFVLAQLYGVSEEFEGEYTKFARLGSGSACRSLYGGFVQWHRGFDHIDEVKSTPDAVSNRSIATKVDISQESLNFWLSNLQIFICVVKPKDHESLQKDVPSTDGMKISLETSELMALRLADNVPQRHINELTGFLEERNFSKFAELTMRESNQLHAVCLDTYPPIFYMNETSKHIIKACT
jgi:diphosphomevalonate decarboxylase